MESDLEGPQGDPSCDERVCVQRRQGQVRVPVGGGEAWLLQEDTVLVQAHSLLSQQLCSHDRQASAGHKAPDDLHLPTAIIASAPRKEMT